MFAPCPGRVVGCADSGTHYRAMADEKAYLRKGGKVKKLRPPSAGLPIIGLVHVSGSRHGTTEMLFDDALVIGTAADAEIHLPADHEPAVAPSHARLERRDGSYLLRASPGELVRVNGEAIDEALLAPGDVIEIGDGGPKLRFRVYRSKPRPYKTMTEALADCADCAHHRGRGRLSKAGTFLRHAPRELATHTSRRFRWGVAALVLLAVSVGVLTFLNLRLGRQLADERLRIDGLADLVTRTEELTVEDIRRVRSELEEDLSGTRERVSALEQRAGAGRRVIATAASSVVFLQGSYGFVSELNRRLLRFEVGPDGRPVTDEAGNPGVSPDANGPPVESFFTGTAFVATDDGLLVTNRHVALPWEHDATARAVIAQGFEAQITGFVGYVAGAGEPYPVELVAASDEADVAVLRCGAVAGRLRPIPLRETPIEAGDDVIVLGYPTGLRALLARADERFVNELMRQGGLDFWEVGRRLAAAGHVAPLATRGIVGQVTPAAVVYDADTTSGGSGGPVVDLRGEAVAVNAAILPEFGGANQGVPVAAARRLLETLRPPEVRVVSPEGVPVDP